MLLKDTMNAQTVNQTSEDNNEDNANSRDG